ncbi:MAG: protein TolR [Gammaproteobacteria bacterium]|nr:protein TolR [Gammaproteobacteria bacterium]
MARLRTRKTPISEINVVPYIDVMLVLLVIFMITAPLLTQGVKVDLPQAEAEIVDANTPDPLVVSVTAEGDYYLNYGSDKDSPVNPQRLVTLVSALLRHRPGIPVLVKGDRNVPYGDVVIVMALLQKAGAPSVGLMTEAPETDRK